MMKNKRLLAFKNVEAELCYGWSSATDAGSNNADFTRRVWRGQVDFHF